MSCHLIKECCTRDGSRSTEVAVQAEASNHLTKWLWDGNKPLHEWKEFDFKETTPDELITWIFEEDSFAPAAKIKGDKKYSLVCDHLGTPTQGYNEEGALIWERQLDSYGKIKMLQGDEGFCNYLYQGQTLDVETGLAYNRFRYYDNEEGVYISQDPLGLLGGLSTFYGYVIDPNVQTDPLGLLTYNTMPGKTNYQKHHVVPQQLKNNPAFKKSGIKIHDPSNVKYLPTKSGIDPNPNLSIHNGSHPKYTQVVERDLNKISKKANGKGWTQAQYKAEVDKVINKYSTLLNKGKIGCK